MSEETTKGNTEKKISVPRDKVNLSDVANSLLQDGMPSSDLYKNILWDDFKPKSLGSFVSRLRVAMCGKLIVPTDVDKKVHNVVSVYFKEIDKDKKYIIYE